MKKIISAVAAVFTAFTAVSAASADKQKYFSPNELSGLLDYMTGKADSSEIMDTNGDGTVNLLDTIYVKNCINNDYTFYQHILSCADYDRDVCSNEKLSSMASVVSKLIGDSLWNNPGLKSEDVTKISSDDGSELSEKINTELTEKYGYRNLKWMAKYQHYGVITVLCTVNGENTGAYPSAISDDIYIPYDETFLHNSVSSDFDWKSYYSSTQKLNEDAKYMVQSIRTIINNAVKKGKISEDEFAGDFVIDSRSLKGTYFEALEESFRNFIFRYNTDWIISGRDGIPYSVVITNLSGYTGAFPAAVPQNLDIPYSPELIEYASGNKKWKDDFADCISENSERSTLPDYPEISDKDALLNALILYNSIEWWYSSENEFIPEDGSYSSDDAFDTIPEIMEYSIMRNAMTAFSHEHYIINVENGIIVSAEYINDAYGKKAFADKEIFDENVSRETVQSEHHYTGSSQIINGSGSKDIPDPDYTFYYSTDEDNYDLSVLKYKGDEKENNEDISGTATVLTGNDKFVTVAVRVDGNNTMTGGYGNNQFDSD